MAERDIRLDGLKGLALISVVFIHTVFWSGDIYVPAGISGFWLLVEVPLFLFLAGWSYTKVSTSAAAWRNLWRLQLRYMAFVTLIWLLVSLASHHLNPLLLLDWLVHIYTPSDPLQVVMGSMWFMRVYLAVSALAILVLSASKRAALLLAGLLIGVVYGQGFTGAVQLQASWLIALEYLTFYLALFLTGFAWATRLLPRTAMAVLAAMGVAYIVQRGQIVASLGNLQHFKFPPQALYFAWSWLSLSVLLALSQWRAMQHFLALPLLQWAGRNAIYLYFAQGVSASLLYWPARHIHALDWVAKLLLLSLLNLCLALLLAWLLAWLLREGEHRSTQLYLAARARLRYSKPG